MANVNKIPMNSNLNTKEGKTLGAFHYFGTNPPTDKHHKLFRVMVSKCLAYLSLANAEEVLAITVPEGFVKDAKAAGWTLVDAVTTARDEYAAKTADKKAKQGKKSKDGAEADTKALASLLAGIAPGLSPVELLAKLQSLIEARGEAAVSMLFDCERSNGRDPKHYIYLRKVTRNHSPATGANANPE